MLFNLLVPLAGDFQFFNLFRYLTFRTGGSVVTALVISFIIGPYVINWLKSKQGEGQPIREDGPASHLLTKRGTPTMGGVLILLGLFLSVFLWCDLTNHLVWFIIFITFSFGSIGAIDDIKKIKTKSSAGISLKIKMLTS